MRVIDGSSADSGAGLHDWDLSALLTTQPVNDDTVRLVFRCNGNDITFYSIQDNGGSVEVVNDTYTLTGTSATVHGAGSGADWYGFSTNDDDATGTERFRYFKVESIPA